MMKLNLCQVRLAKIHQLSESLITDLLLILTESSCKINIHMYLLLKRKYFGFVSEENYFI